MRRRLAAFVTGFATALVLLVMYGFASAHQYRAFWRQTPGAVRLYGRSPDTKYIEAYRAASRAARVKLFRFTDPRLVQTNDAFDIWYHRWRHSAVIAVTDDGGTLIIDHRWMAQFADEDLECIFAHELGHVIDFQRSSERHPDMQRLICMDSQHRADALGRLLCGADRYDRVFHRYIKRRFSVNLPCEETTPVP